METIQKNRSGVVFARTASVHQSNTGSSIASQVRACEIFARKHNVEIEKVFATVGNSGDDNKKDLLKYVKQNDIDYVLVASLDRLSRSQRDFWLFNLELEELGATIVDTRFPTLAVDNDLILSVQIALAEYDRRVRSAAIKRGLEERKQRLCNGSKISDGLLHRSELRATI